MPEIRDMEIISNENFIHLEEAFSGIERKIEDELNRSDNDWLACFGSNTFNVGVALVQARDCISEDKYLEVYKILEELRKRCRELRSQNSGRKLVLDENTKLDLLSDFYRMKATLFGDKSVATE